MNYEELFFKCCLGCGEEMQDGMGLIYQMTHPCNTNRVAYTTIYTGRWFMNQMKSLFGGSDGLECLNMIDYNLFPYFRSMIPEVEYGIAFIDVTEEGWQYKAPIIPEHPLDRMLYSHGRQYERKALPIIKAFIEREKAFDRKF